MIVDVNVSIEGADGAPVDPEQLIAEAKAKGLDALVLSSSVELDADLKPYTSAAEASDVRVFCGAQVRTNFGIILCVLPDGSTLAPDFAERDGEVYDADSVVDAIEEANGVTIALRPYDRDVDRPMGDHLFSLQGLGACEALNGGVAEIANDLALEAATNLEMPLVGGSNARGLHGLGTVATVIKGAVADQEALCEALRDGACWPVAFSDAAPNLREQRSGRGGRSSEGGSRGKRRRSRGGGGRGGDDRGNRRTRSKSLEDLPENIGNRRRTRDESRPVDDNAGNKLRPGETSPFKPKSRDAPEFLDDEDDNIGNR